jgi:hypothetical protein
MIDDQSAGDDVDHGQPAPDADDTRPPDPAAPGQTPHRTGVRQAKENAEEEPPA